MIIRYIPSPSLISLGQTKIKKPITIDKTPEAIVNDTLGIFSS